MILEHEGHTPTIHPEAWVAPNAVVCGDVTLGPGCRILYGAQIVAEGGSITLGRDCIVLENAVLRSAARHMLAMGDHCLVGPNAHVAGATVEDEVFIATGAAVFHGSRLGRGSEVRIHGVVHCNSHLPAEATVPIGWVAVGSPAEILPPGEHDAIWGLQEPLDFPRTVYGLERNQATMPRITRRLSERLGSHLEDRVVTASDRPAPEENGES